MQKLVAVNEKGRRIGESHPRAKLKDWEIDLLRELVEELIEEGVPKMQAYQLAAEKFELALPSVRKIVNCQRRAQTPERYKRIT